jgi:ribonuclease HII
MEPHPIIGCDEAGRGCLFGRVYAGAVILQLKDGKYKDIRKYKDSKLLSEERREELFDSILTHHHGAIAFAEVEEIESLNILWASMLAMKRAIEQLQAKLGIHDGHVLVDGNRQIPELKDFLQTAVVKGDLRVKPIAAASILAKVARDRYVREQAEKFPQYGLARHKGYATREHRKAIKKYGPTLLHRKFFDGVQEYWIESDGPASGVDGAAVLPR